MINLIAAVGQNGEIGKDGLIPWFDDPAIANATSADLGWFAKQTEGGVLIVGMRTYLGMKSLGFKAGSRAMQVFAGRNLMSAEDFLEAVEQRYPGRDIWVCGGAKTYEAFMPYVQRFYVSRIPWTGDADRYMPPLPWGRPTASPRTVYKALDRALTGPSSDPRRRGTTDERLQYLTDAVVASLGGGHANR